MINTPVAVVAGVFFLSLGYSAESGALAYVGATLTWQISVL